MRAKRRPFPRSFELPGGFHVEVDLGSLPSNLLGEWYVNSDGDGGKILVKRTLSRRERISTLIHEVDHALVDWKQFFQRMYE